MWVWPFLPIPTIWDNCMTETQQIEYLKNCVEELEARVTALENKAGFSRENVRETVDKSLKK